MQANMPSFTGKRVLITGGCGFLGSNLARRLINDGAKVSLFVRPGKNKDNILDIVDKVEIIEGSLLNEKDYANMLKEKDFLFHFAWQTDLKASMQHPQEDVSSDIISLLNILEFCRKENPSIKIIFPSTTTVIGIPENIPSDESATERPLSIYEVNKLTAEKYLQMYSTVYGLKTVTLRLSNVFGEYQRIDNPGRGVLNFMIGRALRGEPLTVYGTGDFIRDYSYVQDYIDAFLFAAESEKTNGEVYVLGSGIGKSMNEVVNSIKKEVEQSVGKIVTITHVPFPGDENTINKRNFIADTRKLRTATGWSPRIGFDEGLRKTIDFYSLK